MKATRRITHAGGPARVLVVDDDAPLTELWTRALRRAGFDAHGAVHPDEALALAAELRPQVVVVDVELPGMDGRALGRRLRRLDDTLSILVVTGHTTLLDRREAEQRGFFGPLIKPVSLRDLRRMVELLVGVH